MSDADDARFTPASIGPRELAITWGDGRQSVFAVRALRLACGCASCVDEWSGEGRLDPVGICPFRRLRELDRLV